MTLAYLILGLPLLLLALTPFIPAARSFIDLPSHFVMQYFIAALFLLALGFIAKLPLWSMAPPLVALVLSVLHLGPYLPLKQGQGEGLRLLQANVLKLNPDPLPLKNLIAKEKPDIVLAAEVTPAFQAMFEGLKADYPHQEILSSAKNSYGMAALSKIPFEKMAQERFGHPDIPALIFRVEFWGRKIDILSLHPANPLFHMDVRDRELEAAAKTLTAEKPAYLIVAGDLNATPFCRAFKLLRGGLNLTDARLGFGYFGSYPASSPVSALRIPIDHVLLGPNLAALDFRLGPDIGSDHLPTLSVIGLK